MQLNVTKRNGTHEPINLEKIHKVLFWATEGLKGVSVSEIELRSQIQFFNNMESKDIHEIMIKAAADLISEDSPNYQYVAGRLVNYQLRKQVYGGYDPVHIRDIVKRNAEAGYYDPSLLGYYSDAEWDQINDFIDHSRDESLAYVAMEQLRGKYLVQNRVSGEIRETPQVCYALIAATLFHSYPAETRMDYVRDYYNAISRHDISLPTPVMAGVRTAERQFSSCTLIEVADSLDSINAASAAVINYVSQKAGIGLSAGRIRALASPIRNGAVSHTGITPFLKHFQSAVNSCNQGGVRKGSATVAYPIWHYEIESLLVLKNNKGTEETRVRHLDYSVQFNKLFYERLIQGGDITLFSPHDVVEMHAAFFADYDKFKTLYEAAEKNTKIRKKKIKAVDLFTSFIQERKDTGRIYLQNVDNANQHSPFKPDRAPITMSNLCQEIGLPTVPMSTIERRQVKIHSKDFSRYFELAEDEAITVKGIVSADERFTTLDIEQDQSRIALCILSAINWGNIKSPDDFKRPCELAVRGLDALIDYQTYPVKAAAIATREFRPIGVGIINLAYWMAKNDLRYSDGSALVKIDEYAEAWSYYLLRASVDLAKEKGACERFNDLKYANGILPIDTRKIEVDALVPHVERMDWDGLRADVMVYGIRNATNMALMPAETSAQCANATNGIEAPRALVSVKQSKHGVLKQVVPEIKKLKNKYELLWDQKSPEGYLQICAVLQKYIDQGISVNTSYNPAFYPDEKIPTSELLKHILMFYKFGGKQLYYNNTNDGAGEIDIDKMSKAADQANDAEDDCDACKL